MARIDQELIAGVLNSVKRSEIDDHKQDDTVEEQEAMLYIFQQVVEFFCSTLKKVNPTFNTDKFIKEVNRQY
jgi:hypothetical protein